MHVRWQIRNSKSEIRNPSCDENSEFRIPNSKFCDVSQVSFFFDEETKSGLVAVSAVQVPGGHTGTGSDDGGVREHRCDFESLHFSSHRESHGWCALGSGRGVGDTHAGAR